MASKSAKRKAGGTPSRTRPTMRISKRVVNTKRHTTGYMISGKFHSVREAKRLATQGRIQGVRVVGNHIQAENGRKLLSSLPTTVRK